ncbi:MAG: cellulase family glycosylhydrolase [Chitinispirillaceae bacterium]|nr:cellulase family glycosylhydrolase [Chitinispirillaceae bacterium]
MRSRLKICLLPILVLLSPFAGSVKVLAEENGFYIKNGRILEYNGSDFIARGINYPYAWFAGNWNSSVTGIAGTGANCMRVVLSNGKRWSKTSAATVQQIIQKCKDAKLVAILEVHDCTGYSEQSGSVPLNTAVDYWKEIKSVLSGQEKYVWINIANEPFGNDIPKTDWIDQHRKAITDLRGAGFEHLLVVDAANWGQDWEKITYGSSGSVLEADPMIRTVISVHMYDVYKSDNEVNGYLHQFAVTKKWPLIVGEFAADHGSGKPVDEQAILDRCMEYGLGYIGWSWSGNGSGLGSLDITNNFNAGSLSAWGTTLIKGKNGIKETSSIACIFGGKFIEPPVSIRRERKWMRTAPVDLSRRDGELRIAVSGKVSIRLYDLCGRLVRSSSGMIPTTDRTPVSIPTAGLSGTFILRCSSGNTVVRQSVMPIE